MSDCHPEVSRLDERLGKIGVHEHLCLIHGSQDLQLSAALSFMRIGLERGEKCLYIANTNSTATFENAMRAQGIDTDAAVRQGSLTITNGRGIYPLQGDFDPDRMIGVLTEWTRAAKSSGFSALRLADEMTWVTEIDPRPERLIEYEAKLNQFFRDQDALALCQYDRRVFPPEVILNVLRTHPIVVYDDLVWENPYYVPPDELFHPAEGERQLQRLLNNIQRFARAEEALRRSERQQRQTALQLEIERARLIQAQAVANVGSWEAELPSLNVIWSEQTHRIFETDPSRFQPTRPKFREFIHPEDRAKADAAFLASLDKRSPGQMEYRIVMPDGRVKIIEERWQVFHNEQGQPVRLVGACLDVTERRRTEEQIRSAHQRLSYHVENSPLAVVEWDSNFRVQRWSHHAEELFGWRAEEVMGRLYTDWPFVHPEDEPAVAKIIAGLLQGTEPNNFSINRNYTKDGRIVYCEWYNSALLGRDGGLVSILSLVHDVTQRKQAEEAVLQSRQQLRVLSSHVETLREEERTRISREIHDELGQMLTGIKMDLRWMENSLDEFGYDRRLNPILDKLVATAELTDATVKTVQRIAAELRPGVLDKLGLPAALQYEAAAFETRSGIPCRVLGPSDLPSMGARVSTAFFRIFQEALTNVSRHAKATAVEAEIQVEAAGYRLEIRDNGAGITPADVAKPSSLGLLGMQERARFLGGDVTLTRRPGGGTIVTVQIPNSPDP
jgi:PAS domain S-box-containing protein